VKTKKTPHPRRGGTEAEFVRLATELEQRDPDGFRKFLGELRQAAQSAKRIRGLQVIRKKRTK